MATADIVFDSVNLQAQESTFAPLEQLSGASGTKVFVRAFDYTTVEYASGKFLIPTDVDTAGTVTLRYFWMPRTVSVAANEAVVWTFDHLALNNDEDFDPAGQYTSVVATADAESGVQDQLTETIKTVTLSTLGWTANELIIFRVQRDADDVNDTLDTRATTADDAILFLFSAEVPLT